MKVPAITNYNYKKIFTNLKQTEAPSEQEQQEIKSFCYTDLVFCAGVKSIKPNFKKPLLEKVSTKITKYLEIIPEHTRMAKPTFLKIDDKIFEFSIDKTSPINISNVSIKMFNNDILENTLSMTLSKRGFVTSATYSEPNGKKIVYEHTHKTRKITCDKDRYKPSSYDDNIWIKTLITSENNSSNIKTPEKFRFGENELQEFFGEVIKKNTSFLAK